eukprot:PITA_08326
MGKIHHDKRGCWNMAPVGVLLCLMPVISAQPGFLSISCGGRTNYTEDNIAWVTDAPYIDIGETADIGNASQGAYGSYLHHLRLFPKPLNKSCYQLPVSPNVPYLLRLWFAVGNYDGFTELPSFSFSIETPGLLAVVQRTTRDVDAHYNERIFVSSGTVLCVCLIRTSESDDPFISAIELRTFQDDMYGEVKPGTMSWPGTYDVGGESPIRYPQDKFDRIWTNKYLEAAATSDFVNSQEAISTHNTKDLPPTAVMQTAWLGNSRDINISSSPYGTRSLLLLYFAEIKKVNTSESRSFYVEINGKTRTEIITLAPNYSTLELTFFPYRIYSFNIVKAPKSTLGPILNAFEYHWLYETDEATYSQDIDALHSIKINFDIKDWISDPCYLFPWKGIVCDNSSSPIRISEINLSGRNLAGSMPSSIGQLTALVNLSLENNHIIGTLPDLSNLIMLERLNIENNNFSGAIPANLLLHCSLKFNYSGNRYLPMDKRECTPKKSKNNTSKVVLVTTLSGILTVALIAGIIVYLKLRRKEAGVTNNNRLVKTETKPFLYQESSMITVPNPTKSRAFTLDDMIAATKDFSTKIGQGGFGSVFFGELPEGKYIAVKVLSSSSQQGVHEFLNEVDLLSKINHRNLVSLLGYCNQSRKVMLIYEHMSGGSLMDHLYGVNAGNSELNWKIRLKIALDAAQGLEYLHIGCIPKIIHRDIKTANILIDSNMNGKLADFGLSRTTIDEKATHVTTAVKGTLGYLDPEYFNTQMLTEKSDVFSFGVVLLEIICGRKPIDLTVAEEDVNIIRWVTPYLLDMDKNACITTKIIDKRLGSEGSNMKSITRVAKVAMRCVEAQPSSRPSVSDVVEELKKALKIENEASISEEIRVEGGDSSKGEGNNTFNISKAGRRSVREEVKVDVDVD